MGEKKDVAMIGRAPLEKIPIEEPNYVVQDLAYVSEKRQIYLRLQGSYEADIPISETKMERCFLLHFIDLRKQSYIAPVTCHENSREFVRKLLNRIMPLDIKFE